MENVSMTNSHLKKKEQQLASQDTARARRWAEKELDKFNKIRNDPVAPLINRIMFICMIISPVLSLISELTSYFRFQYLNHNKIFLLKNLSRSLLFGWGFFSVFVIILSFIQQKTGFTSSYFEKYRYARNGRPNDLYKQYSRRIVIAVSGIVVFLIFFFITEFYL